MKCADCDAELTPENAPSDGWQLEDGRTVCTKCCAQDLNRRRQSYDVKPRLSYQLTLLQNIVAFVMRFFNRAST